MCYMYPILYMFITYKLFYINTIDNWISEVFKWTDFMSMLSCKLNLKSQYKGRIKQYEDAWVKKNF